MTMYKNIIFLSFSKSIISRKKGIWPYYSFIMLISIVFPTKTIVNKRRLSNTCSHLTFLLVIFHMVVKQIC